MKKINISTIQKAVAAKQVAVMNSNGLEFVSIEDEIYRTYIYFRNGEKIEVTIEAPKWLYVRPSGAHLVMKDDSNVVYYMPKDFVQLIWQNSDPSTPASF